MNYNSSATANRKSTTMPAFRRQSSRLSTKSPDRLEFRRQSSRLSTKSPDRPEFRRQSSRLSTKSPERLEFRRQSSRLSTKSPDRPNSSLRISLTPKKSSGQRDSIQAFTSGIKSSNPKQLNFQKDKDISQSQSKKKQVVVISSMPPPDLLYSRSTSPRRTLYNFSPLLEEDIKKTNVDIVETKSRKSVIPQISVENRKKSIVASAASLEQLRKATVKNMIEVDESTLDMNDEGVSFSLSSRIRRKTIVLDEKNSISNEAPARLGRKFKDMSSHLSGSIVIVQDPADEPDLLKAPDTKSHTSNEGLSRTNDGTQTISAYSANVEDSPVKKLFAATVKKPSSRPEPKTLLKAPPGSYMGILVHPKLMRPPFPFPSKRQILFGPYENPLLEVEESLCIQHLFHNLDYYYMPTDPIRKSLLDPKRFTFALEPIYNEKHVAKEVLTMLPIKRHS